MASQIVVPRCPKANEAYFFCAEEGCTLKSAAKCINSFECSECYKHAKCPCEISTKLIEEKVNKVRKESTFHQVKE